MPRNISTTAIMEIKMGIIVRNEILTDGLTKCLKKLTAIMAGNVPNPKAAMNDTL